jgi:hypothetical protein
MPTIESQFNTLTRTILTFVEPASNMGFHTWAEASGSRETSLETQPENSGAIILEDGIIVVSKMMSSISASRTSSEGPENGLISTDDQPEPQSSEIPPSSQRHLHSEASPQRKRSKGRNGKANPTRNARRPPLLFTYIITNNTTPVPQQVVATPPANSSVNQQERLGLDAGGGK